MRHHCDLVVVERTSVRTEGLRGIVGEVGTQLVGGLEAGDRAHLRHRLLGRVSQNSEGVRIAAQRPKGPLRAGDAKSSQWRMQRAASDSESAGDGTTKMVADGPQKAGLNLANEVAAGTVGGSEERMLGLAKAARANFEVVSSPVKRLKTVNAGIPCGKES